MNLSQQIDINKINGSNTNINSNIKESKTFTINSLPILNLQDEEEESSSNYYYNDQVNSTYKPSPPTRKKEKEKEKIKIKNHKNKNLSCVINSTKKAKKPRENYNPLEGSIIKDQNELNILTYRIHGNKYNIIFNLLYKASEDKDKSSIFHRKCDQAQTTLVLIETKKGVRFGGFTKRTWRGVSTEKFDNDAFLFSLDKRQIYNLIKGKNAIGCYSDFGPIFSGGFKIFDDFFKNGGCIFVDKEKNYKLSQNNELTGGEEKFEINEIEVYEIKIA